MLRTPPSAAPFGRGGLRTTRPKAEAAHQTRPMGEGCLRATVLRTLLLASQKAQNVKYGDYKCDLLVMFALEDVLLEKQVISNRREIDWPTVEYYKYFVIRKYTDFQCDQKAFQSFKKH